jgi:ketosteroid isomerase-like protein
VPVTDDLQMAMSRFQRCIEDRDRAAAEAVLDEEYALVLVQPTLAAVPRERWLEVLDDYIVHDYAVEQSVVDIDGDVATVLHRDRMSATVLGEDRSGIFVLTDVWRRRSDGWRLWRRHSTPMSAGAMPGR